MGYDTIRYELCNVPHAGSKENDGNEEKKRRE